jgi:ABC-2 type transport system ATP-binding protein
LPAKRDMWRLQDLARREQVTTFLSSHDAQEIRTLCSQISVIAHGRVVFTGAAQDLGTDLDSFEERLLALLLSREQVVPSTIQ